MALPISLDNTLRLHDEAFDRYLSRIRVDYGTISGESKADFPILRRMASPERSFATIVDWLVSHGWIAGADTAAKLIAAGNFAVLPLPVCTFERGDEVPNVEHSGVPKIWRRGQFDQATQVWVQHQWPAMYTMEYRANFWCLKRYTEAWIREVLMSQLGLVGAGESEVFIDVVHPDPFGTLRQSLRFDASTGLSTLEGDEDQRFIRWEMSFTMNMIHFRAPLGTEEFVDQVVPAESLVTADGVTGDPKSPTGDDFSTQLTSQSQNLFALRPALYDLVGGVWPTAGNATAERSRITPDGKPSARAMKIAVTDTTDEVDITNRPVLLDAETLAILSVSFQYLADDVVGLDVHSNDGQHTPGAAPTWTSALQDDLPAQTKWTKVQRFTVVKEPIFDVLLRGTGPVVAAGHFANLDVRHLRSGTKVAPSSTVVGGSDTTYDWTSLIPSQPYLIVVSLTPVAAADTITANDDTSSPLFVKTEAVDDSINQGAVFLLQPLTDTLQLVVPNALTVAAVFVQRYYGAFSGHEL